MPKRNLLLSLCCDIFLFVVWYFASEVNQCLGAFFFKAEANDILGLAVFTKRPTEVLTPELADYKTRTETLLHVMNDVTRFVNKPGLVCTSISRAHVFVQKSIPLREKKKNCHFEISS